MINNIHSASGPRAERMKAPTFREKDAVCIEIPKANAPRQSSHSAQDRLAQMNYFAQSIAQTMPALRPDVALMARYAQQTPRFSFSV